MTPEALAKFQSDLLSSPLALDIWRDRYRAKGETSRRATALRCVDAVYAKDPDLDAREAAFHLVRRSILVPGGRILAGAGTGFNVTLGNCYASETVQDSMMGIQRAIARAARTLQFGGGIGTDYSTIRPRGALVSRTSSVSRGVIDFARQHNAMAMSILSMNTRRAANMLTLRDDHPDLWNRSQHVMGEDTMTGRKFLVAPSLLSVKTQPGELECFNISVLISDAFLDAVSKDLSWDLGFHVPRADGQHVDVYEKPFPYDVYEVGEDMHIEDHVVPWSGGQFLAHGPRKGTLMPWYVYERLPARELWDAILRTTYEYAEPGLIFIDRVNARNNLNYCETIRTTNPCGEQPLPPDGMCDLGAINLAFLVKDPFTAKAELDWVQFERAIHAGIRFLDNVLDVTEYPLRTQRDEALQKRRIGLGVMGWGDALVQLGIRYDSPEAIGISRAAAAWLRRHSYEASCNLARERGPFPLWNRQKFNEYNIKEVHTETHQRILLHGLRNGVLNTIAPTGTTAQFVGGVSTGHEPVFTFAPSTRKVKQPDGTTMEYPVVPYSLRLWRELGHEGLPPAAVGALELSVESHIRVHAAWSQYIDASVSKTVNCPADMSFEDFAKVYDLAWELGCKGCTTYRPSGLRGAVLAEVKAQAQPAPAPVADDSDVTLVRPRPAILPGQTHKIAWAATGVNWYINITNDGLAVRELFISGGDPESREWTEAFCRAVTAVLRRGGDCRFLAEEMQRVASTHGGAFVLLPGETEHKAHRPSVVAAIGAVLEFEIQRLGQVKSAPTPTTTIPSVPGETSIPNFVTAIIVAATCPKCGAQTLIHEAGCKRCLSCEYSSCG